MKLILAGIIMMVLFLDPGLSQGVLQPGNVISLKKSGSAIIVKTTNALAELQVYSPEIIRIRIVRKELLPDFSYAVIRQPGGQFKQVSELADFWELLTDSLQVRVAKKPFRISIFDRSGREINADYQDFSVTWQGDEVTCYKGLFTEEKFIGLGEKTGPLNRRGNSYVNWNTDHVYEPDADPLYITIPFYIGIHDQVVYGIFLDNSYRTQFNFGASTDGLFSSFTASHGEMNYYFIGGSNVPGIIGNYTWLTGRMPLPPFWSLGYQQCRWSYFPETEVMNIAHNFRERKLPCDVIYLDIDYMDNYKIFTWNHARFPDPKAMIGKLNGMGFHVASIVDPGIKIETGYFAYDEGVRNDYFVKYPDGKFYVGSVWPGRCHFPDFTKPEVREWWGNSFSHLTDPGIEGFWNDMNEPAAWGQSIPGIVQFDFDGLKATMEQAHNVYALNMVRGTYEGTRKLLNGSRPFLLSRAGYAGIQRYSAVWTGDNAASEEHMFTAVRLVNSIGLSGISFCGADVGGFMGTPSPELFVRWMSIGCYTPFFRNHSAINTKAHEPWAFGEYNEGICREILNRRYQLLPYLYAMLFLSTQTGLPVSRTLAIGYPFDETIYSADYQNEYMFGDAFLVAPVSPVQQFAKVYLPGGSWYRISSGKKYEGNHSYIVEAPLSDLPVFVKEGSIIPMQSVVQYADQKPDPVLEIHVYKGDVKTSFLYYEDDGNTYAYQQGGYLKRLITYDPASGKVTFGSSDGNFTSKFTGVTVIFHDPDKQCPPVSAGFEKNSFVVKVPD
jgi:alpha-glucosidase